MNTTPVKALTLGAATLSCAFAVSQAQLTAVKPAPPVPVLAPAAVKPPPPALPVPPPPPDALDETDVQKIVVRANKQAEAEVQRGQAAQMKVQADLARLHGDFFRWSGGKGARVLVVPAEQPQPETVSD